MVAPRHRFQPHRQRRTRTGQARIGQPPRELRHAVNASPRWCRTFLEEVWVVLLLYRQPPCLVSARVGRFGQVVHHPNQSAALSACDTAREIESQTLAELLPPGSTILPGLLLIRAWILAIGTLHIGRDGGGTEGEAAAGIDGALVVGFLH